MARKRAVKVCEACHERKIRCSLDSTDSPCTKCYELGLHCILRARKDYSYVNRKRHLLKSSPVGNDTEQRLDQGLEPSIDPTEIVAAAITEPSFRTTVIFSGDGGYGGILDGAGNSKQQYFLVPGNTERALGVEDLEYLKLKGCFTIPGDSGSLLQAYFQFVHPLFPVIDGPSFLQDYAQHGLQGTNLLLLWSMFSVSAGYLPVASSSQKTRKEMFVQRAKLLFDLSNETDKIVLVQSSLLLSFWFADAEDIKQSWYWTGIAFGLAQTIGLHRITHDYSHRSPFHQQHRSANVWRCCMIRDVWLSWGMGRPLRLNAADCTSPTLSDSECGFNESVFYEGSLYAPTEASTFEQMWRSLVTVSSILREGLTDKKAQPSDLANAFKPSIEMDESIKQSLAVTLASRHLRLCQNAVLGTLWRLGNNREEWKATSATTTSILKSFLSDHTINLVAMTVVPLIVPTMISHLSSLRCAGENEREEAEGSLSECLQFLHMIEENYPAALIVKRLFQKARDSVISSEHGNSCTGDSNADISDEFTSLREREWSPNWTPFEFP